MPAETFDELDARLQAEGWQRGFPHHRGRTLIDGVSIDREVCTAEECPECGHQGLYYVAYTDPERHISTSGYNAVARCPQCNSAMEF